MTDDRRRISIHEETFDALAAGKRDGETWDARLRRLLDGEHDGDRLRIVELADEGKREIARVAADELEQRDWVPDEGRLVRSVAGAVGVGESTHRPVVLNGIDDRDPEDRVLSVLVGAWCGSVLEGDPRIRFVATSELSRVATSDAWRAVRDDGWTVERLERNGGGLALRQSFVVDAVDRPHRRFATKQNHETTDDCHEENP